MVFFLVGQKDPVKYIGGSLKLNNWWLTNSPEEAFIFDNQREAVTFLDQADVQQFIKQKKLQAEVIPYDTTKY